MTREELREALEPILTDETLTGEEARKRMAPIATLWLKDKHGADEIYQAFDLYDTVVAEIVIAHNLQRN